MRTLLHPFRGTHKGQRWTTKSLNTNTNNINTNPTKLNQRLFHSTRYVAKQTCGIVGLPNVGKSLLFNALMGKPIARSENFPFCTIDPNISTTFYEDPKLMQVARIVRPKKLSPVDIEYKDIAGLVQGASDGRGLGNQFLEHIRNVNIILQVVRCFDIESISHVMESVDPIRDIEIVENELLQKDIQSMENIRRGKRLKGLKFDPAAYSRLAETVFEVLQSGVHMSSLGITYGHPDYEILNSFNLLSTKPVLYVANVEESKAAAGNHYSDSVKKWLLENRKSDNFVVASAQLEFELSTLEDQDLKKEFMEGYGITQSAIHAITQKSFNLLGLQTFYTIGKKEVRAWPVSRGATAKECAGKIHSDFIAGFIKAERWNIDDFIKTGGVGYKKDVKGGDYKAQEGDCFEFKVRC